MEPDKTVDVDDTLSTGLENTTLNDVKTDEENAEETTGESTQSDEEDLTIDEEGQKEVEANLTEEEKQSRREEGQKLKTEGNDLFKTQNYHDALKVYTTALRTCPLDFTQDRSILYSNRAACRQHLERNDDAIEDSTKAVELNPEYVKARLRRAQLYEKNDKLDEALEDFKKILESDPGHREALTAVRDLPPKIHERNEKLKAEMMDKLKDLGNLVLRPFGLSTENFKLQQDPSTGSYSVNFQQNPKQ